MFRLGTQRNRATLTLTGIETAEISSVGPPVGCNFKFAKARMFVGSSLSELMRSVR
jgi:hypothetical protein